MGETVESFRIALEGEISRWSGFARALRKPDREASDDLMVMQESLQKKLPFLELMSHPFETCTNKIA